MRAPNPLSGRTHGPLPVSEDSRCAALAPAVFPFGSPVSWSMSRKSVQRFCGNEMRKNKELKRVA